MLIVVSDIFGKTPALEKLCLDLCLKYEIVDPYKQIFLNFKDESQAYSYFSNNVGLEKYSDILEAKIKSTSENCILLGFSIGASAIWKISCKNLQNISKGICFYGSQIRNFTDITPIIPLELVMPKKEDHFCVKELSEKLRLKKNVIIYGTDYLHGFMNFYSKNYDQGAYKKYLNWIKDIIRAS